VDGALSFFNDKHLGTGPSPGFEKDAGVSRRALRDFELVFGADDYDELARYRDEGSSNS
jgi:hypothetical protein